MTKSITVTTLIPGTPAVEARPDVPPVVAWVEFESDELAPPDFSDYWIARYSVNIECGETPDLPKELRFGRRLSLVDEELTSDWGHWYEASGLEPIPVGRYYRALLLESTRPGRTDARRAAYEAACEELALLVAAVEARRAAAAQTSDFE